VHFWHVSLKFEKKHENKHCLWKEILSQQRIRHFKILQSIYFAYDVGIISSYSNRIENKQGAKIWWAERFKIKQNLGKFVNCVEFIAATAKQFHVQVRDRALRHRKNLLTWYEGFRAQTLDICHNGLFSWAAWIKFAFQSEVCLKDLKLACAYLLKSNLQWRNLSRVHILAS